MVAGITSGVQVSGVGCQHTKSIRWMGLASELNFLLPLMTFSLNQSWFRTQDSFFFLTPDT